VPASSPSPVSGMRGGGPSVGTSIHQLHHWLTC
jgi:hypothetical protein